MRGRSVPLTCDPAMLNTSMHDELVEVITNTLLILGALLPIVNPLGNAPIFLSLTRGSGSAARARLSRSIAINGFVLLVASAFIGTYILGFFGISLPVVQVGGGLVVISTGWTLLKQEDDDEAEPATATESDEHLSKRAFYPLTLPLTVGPGSISVAITVGANRPADPHVGWPFLVAELAGPFLIGLSIYLCYRYAESIARAAGVTAMSVIMRLSSFILLCIGVQILWNGASTLIKSLH